jgi:hypothetical protein
MSPYLSRLAALVAVTAAVAGGVTWAASPSGHGPTVDPSDFTSPVANPYYPLTPGTVTALRGTDDGERLVEHVRVTSRTKVIQGVRTRVVRDVVRRVDGSLAERTQDWYAADNAGNVWYFGESTATYDESGAVESREGSWQAGVDGAVAGLIMPADPRPTDAYRQEYYRGHAEDQAWVVLRHSRVSVPYGRLRHVVRTYEWSRLERDVVSVKLYAPGLGIVKERDVAGGNEVFVLVKVEHR